MMSDTQVVYRGTSDFQEFGKKDFAKANIEQNKLSFERNVPKTVSAEVAEALTSKEGIFGPYDFELATDEDIREAVENEDLPPSALDYIEENDEDEASDEPDQDTY